MEMTTELRERLAVERDAYQMGEKAVICGSCQEVFSVAHAIIADSEAFLAGKETPSLCPFCSSPSLFSSFD